ncbi:unnamed protein product [Rotaria sordida]|uniref:F-box domain-containing protein n=1 Tax=Rotaria sordida TaxID=392033 RepID=A0A815M8M8_9BILA|nr:unnamed protein product [Rotaria sordida]CAF1420695.1 unnamed protein product [Rotaria sordida]
MIRTKRQRNNIFNDDSINKKRTLFDKIITINRNKSLFEDLANEILYEIFEYLDIYYVYKGFINLNKRFQNLLFHSTLLIKINISTMPKSKFHHYHINIILPNQHQINSLRLLNPFTVDIVFSPLCIISKFICLETLILDNIKAQYLYKILHHLILLPKFHSLVLNLIEYVQSPSTLFYHEQRLLPIIFHKYQYSLIEHFVINSRIRFDSFNNLLFYLLQLRRLSIDCLVKCTFTNINSHTNFLEHLKYVSLKLDYISFNQEQLISSSMPNLRVFDINHDSSARNNPLIYHNSIK